MQADIYRPERQSSTLGSNQLEITAEMHPRKRWRIDITKWMIGGAHRGRTASRWGQPTPHVRGSSPALVESLLESFGTFPC